MKSEEKKLDKYVNKSLPWIVTVVSIAWGISFLIQICRLYFTNKNNTPIYSPENVGQYLMQILAIVIIEGVVVIASGVYYCIKGKSKEKPQKNTVEMLLNNTLSVLPSDIEQTDPNNYLPIKNYFLKRRIAYIINSVILVLCIVMASCYVLNGKNFAYDGNPTAQVAAMVLHLLPWLILAFVSSSATYLYVHSQSKVAFKQTIVILKEHGREKKTYKNNKLKEFYIINSVRACLLIVAVTFIIYGACNGAIAGALNKAINICTECIGLG